MNTLVLVLLHSIEIRRKQKGKKVNPRYRPYSHGNPSYIDFKCGTQFLSRAGMWEQRGSSGEIVRFPQMWPGFDSCRPVKFVALDDRKILVKHYKNPSLCQSSVLHNGAILIIKLLFQENLKGIQMVFMNMLAETDGIKWTFCIEYIVFCCSDTSLVLQWTCLHSNYTISGEESFKRAMTLDRSFWTSWTIISAISL